MTLSGPDLDGAARLHGVSLQLGGNQILRNVHVSIPLGRYVALVGESGSGKSTIARVLVGRFVPDRGEVVVAGMDLMRLRKHGRMELYRKVQLIPQDPYSSLDPRRTIGQTLAEAVDPVKPDLAESRPLILDTLAALQLTHEMLDRYPHEFSGGQRQRIAIARALLVKPQLMIADEITSALDVSVQVEVVSILRTMRSAANSTMLFITHNLAMARDLCDDVIVMRDGQIMEAGEIEAVYKTPRAAYTRELLASIPGQVPRAARESPGIR